MIDILVKIFTLPQYSFCSESKEYRQNKVTDRIFFLLATINYMTASI